MEQEMEIIQGVISAVVYQNYENGYAVLRLGVGGGQSVTVVGTIPLPAVGERLIGQAAGDGHARDDMTVLCARVGRAAGRGIC